MMNPVCYAGYRGCARTGFPIYLTIRLTRNDPLCNLKTLCHGLELGKRAKIAKQFLALTSRFQFQNRLKQFFHFSAVKYFFRHDQVLMC